MRRNSRFLTDSAYWIAGNPQALPSPADGAVERLLFRRVPKGKLSRVMDHETPQPFGAHVRETTIGNASRTRSQGPNPWA